jgi:hypothetical protein
MPVETLRQQVIAGVQETRQATIRSLKEYLDQGGQGDLSTRKLRQLIRDAAGGDFTSMAILEQRAQEAGHDPREERLCKVCQEIEDARRAEAARAVPPDEELDL